METKEKVRVFLRRFFRKHEISDDEDIFSLGFVNSLFSMQLIMFLEKEFSFTIGNEDMDMKNFRSINSIVKFIQRKS